MKNAGHIKTEIQAIESKAPTLGAIKRVNGPEFTSGMVKVWIIYLNEILDLKNQMNEAQIILAAQEICNDYNHFKFSDLTLIFKRILSGEYGKLYERLSIVELLTIFREYNAKRLDKSAEISQRKHKDFKSQDNFNVSGKISIKEFLNK